MRLSRPNSPRRRGDRGDNAEIKQGGGETLSPPLRDLGDLRASAVNCDQTSELYHRGGQQPIIEIIVCSIEDAVAAERGGANRLEIISHYEAGGLTPSLDLVREITSTVKIPARVMLRESEPFVVTDEEEIERLRDAA